jgi:hypothetical protein
VRELGVDPREIDDRCREVGELVRERRDAAGVGIPGELVESVQVALRPDRDPGPVPFGVPGSQSMSPSAHARSRDEV